MTLKTKRVLIIEDAPEVRKVMEYAFESGQYELHSIENGMEALETIKQFRPHLILLDIMMPGIHGFEVLKQIKADPETKDISVIICSGKNFKTDIDTAFRLGASDYITKPFDLDILKEKVEAAISANGSVLYMQESFPLPQREAVYLPTLDISQCYLKFWGSRGSVPVAGQTYLRYGGNTPCLEIHSGNETIIIDAGTGIRELGMQLEKENTGKIHLFIGHTHWDHIQGFPFFPPAYLVNQEILIYGAAGYGKDLKSAFKGQLATEYFPVQLEDMKATMIFNELDTNPVTIGNLKVYWEYVNHPGAAIGFKFTLNGKTIVYITDNEFLQGYLGNPNDIHSSDQALEPYKHVINFISNADILISEAQYPNEEYTQKIGWGHSSLSNACLLTKFGNVKRWIITHHDPMHNDNFLDLKLLLTRQLLRDLDYSIEVQHAYDGMVMNIL